MPTRLEERLRRYGETIERAIVTDARTEPARPVRRAPIRRPRLVVALGAAAAVVGMAVAIAVMIRPADESTVSPRRQQHTPSLGIDHVWPGPDGPAFDLSSPTAAATSFTQDVVGERPAGTTADPDAPIGPTWVHVTLSNGTAFQLLCVPTAPDRWVVQDVGETTGLELGAPPARDATLYELQLDASTGYEHLDVAWRDEDGVHVKTTSAAETAGGRIPINVADTLHSATVVLRDAPGAPLGVIGGFFIAPDEVVSDAGKSVVRVLVLNAGQATGAATNKANQLRTFGYNLLPAADAPPRTGIGVQCREGFADPAVELATDVGEGAEVEPFVEPPTETGAPGADCVVYMGR